MHFEALLLDPVRYLRCLRWWMAGKRLRARLGLAPLLGRAAHAYSLWQVRYEPLTARPEPPNPPRIIALVGDGTGIAATLASLAAERFEAQVVAEGFEIGSLADQRGAWLMPLASGDVLASGAGAWYRAAAKAAQAATQVIYADDDLKGPDRERHLPHLKPDWNSELFRHFDFLTGASIVRASSAPASNFASQGWAARLVTDALHAANRADEAALHIPAILHHRRIRPAPCVPLAPVQPTTTDHTLPRVSILIPTHNRHDLLGICLDGLSRTIYPHRLDIIVIDNRSDDPATLDFLRAIEPAFANVTRDDGPFNFAAINNRAVHAAQGELLCFLNNDVELTDPYWLIAMARQAVRADVGAVGAQLLYPDGRIQHAGVVVGIGGAAAHAHRLIDPQEEGYFYRHALPQFTSAVTAACMVVERAKFVAVGGFDAERFAVSFNDVDLCLRLAARGWRSLYEPRARAVHHESASRGLDRDPRGAARQAREVMALEKRWGTKLALFAPTGDSSSPDPFHHPALSRLSEQFVLDL
ncbi:glycosyltransferase family 2 protein [Erythrobacter sanguineus]|nr:glycosyltransferase family 2 protein [Erythrobacter sanguineus]